jgi:hypothetical protein
MKYFCLTYEQKIIIDAYTSEISASSVLSNNIVSFIQQEQKNT